MALKVVGGSANEATDDGVMRAMRELSLLRDCRSPQIVQFMGACLWQGRVSGGSCQKLASLVVCTDQRAA